MQYNDNDLRKLQLLELRILKEIDRVCRELGITYFLDSGSVLGALRHGGFIPWDDDIDLGMPRADYDRFVAEAPAFLGEEYVVSTPETNPHQAALFGKVWLRGTRFATEETIEAGFDQGIFVDLLPYDALSSDPATAAKQRRDSACEGQGHLHGVRRVLRVFVRRPPVVYGKLPAEPDRGGARGQAGRRYLRDRVRETARREEGRAA